MSYLLNNKKVFGAVVAAILAVITLTVTVFAVLANTAGQAPKEPESQVESISEESSDLEQESQPEEPPETEQISTGPIVFNNPDEMRGAWLVPGVDFPVGESVGSAAVKAGIDKAVVDAKSLGMNTVIVDTVFDGLALYQTDYSASLPHDFDVLNYIITKAKAEGMYVYAKFDVQLLKDGSKMAAPLRLDAVGLTNIYENARAFAQKYGTLSGVLLDQYYLGSSSKGSSYMTYLSSGGGMGFENYMLDNTESVLKAVVEAFNKGNRSIQVGLLADSVWANKSSNEMGSETASSFQALVNGYADTKKFVEEEYFDFIAVKAFGSRTNQQTPFSSVVSWWAALAQQKNIPLYAVHASSKAVSNEAGWTSPTELTQQVMAAREITGYKGSMFDSLSRLKADPQGSTAALQKLFNEELDVQYFATKLEIAKPKERTFTTYEPTVVFSGSSDPYFEAMFNDEKLVRDSNGYFSVELELKVGLNTFTFKHKDQTVTFNITRVVKVLESISPQGTLTVNGGTEVTVSAMAYKDATVTASLGGRSITLTKDTADDDSTDKDTNFVKFSGKFTMPAGSSSVQQQGNIVISASWSGVTDSLQGANVTINKKATIEDGVLVQVVASQAETFPDNTLDDNSMPAYYPLCKGSLDFVVGSELIYKEGSTTFTYYNLASGRRVYAKDISTVGGSLEDNVIAGMQVDSDSRHTHVMFNMSQTAAYTLSYSSSAITIDFHYTSSVPDGMSLSKNPLFSSASWSGQTLTLKLKNAFLGYRAYYDDGLLVFEFNNPPASMSSARIVLDPGHSSVDPGAMGFRSDYNEYEINQAITKHLKAQLEDMGAYVYVNNVNNGRVELITRMNNGKNADPHVLVSVHANSFSSSSAYGSEAYYFYPFSSSLASGASKAAASALDTTNRGAKFGRFYMTRDSEFPSILLETGFVSNQDEYYNLISTSYQKSIASNVANAIKNFLSSAGMGSTATGTQTSGNMGGANVAVSKVALDKTEASVEVGKVLQLTATVTPANASNKTMKWQSSKESVATVSETGVVTGVKEGTTTITAINENSGKKATCVVTVKKSTGETVSISETALTLKTGKTHQLSATVANGVGTFTWESSKSAVAKVDENGLVTAVKAGTATITVKSAGGGTAQCIVTVSDSSSSSGSGSSSSSATDEVTLLPKKEEVTVSVGSSVVFEYVVTPDRATVSDVKFSLGDKSLGTIDKNGKFTASQAGNCTITVSAKVNDKEMSYMFELYVVE